jgi:membrane-associated phospholipid phosphatase
MPRLLWQQASLAFFVYVLLVRLAWTGSVPRPGRLIAGAGSGIALTLLASITNDALATWIWPPLVLLVAYWTSGLLFRSPSPSQEQALARVDARLNVRRVAARVPRALAEVLELAYVGVYPMVLLALVLHLAWASPASAATFWNVVLITDFICFAVLPWVQTRPPRALEGSDPWRSSVRSFNLRLLGSTSIQVNTFPSGHAAEALAAALLTLDAPAPIVAFMFLGAVAVSAGAVLGRYHYFADALIGWLVALAVWAVVT